MRVICAIASAIPKNCKSAERRLMARQLQDRTQPVFSTLSHILSISNLPQAAASDITSSSQSSTYFYLSTLLTLLPTHLQAFTHPSYRRSFRLGSRCMSFTVASTRETQISDGMPDGSDNLHRQDFPEFAAFDRVRLLSFAFAPC